MPVFPDAVFSSKSAAGSPSFAVYRSPSGVDEVYRWYLVRLPAGTPHAFSAGKSQATFAIFGRRERRTIHLQPLGAGTEILLTDSPS